MRDTDEPDRRRTIRIATAAWAIPKASASRFPPGESALERYAGVFDAVEINTTFYRSHRPSTYQRWAAATPDGFSFAVKVPKAVTHEAGLRDCDALIDGFLKETAEFGPKRGPILLQLPPKLAFDADLAGPVCDRLVQDGLSPVVCEPRHPSWFAPAVDHWLAERRVARVAADPARHPGADRPGGWRGLSYYRLHGSPRIYYSEYGEEALSRWSARIAEDPAPAAWCVFDNTALGAATADALDIKKKLSRA
ncbi:MAG: DUF72 domain-containing protein [Hansschlegelia sp.]